MEIDYDSLFQDMVNVFGTEVSRYQGDDEELVGLDYGFRKQWFEREPYQYLREQFEQAQEGTLYELQDSFGDNFFYFRLPALSASVYVVGPFLTVPISSLIQKMQEQNQLTLVQIDMIRSYLKLLPEVTVDLLRQSLCVLLKRVWPESMHTALIADRFLDFDLPISRNLLPEEKISMRMIEARYKIEDDMLQAIAEGNYDRAVEIQRAFQKYEPRERYNQTIQQNKIAMLTFNTLCRKAVQNAAVHPAHIDNVSSEFAARILRARSGKELVPFFNEMLRKYCLLVRSYSLKGYSRVVQDAINYIDFNLQESLSLALVAKEISADRKYLSTLFRKETGKTLTDYIREKRIQQSLRYLGLTSASVADIAERVGILDVNYFSRLFHKQVGMTPSHYRQMIQGKK